MRAKTIMTKQVITVNKNELISEAAKKMKDAGVGTVVVEENGIVEGIITDRDIVLRNVATNGNPSQVVCGDVMTSNVTTANPDIDVDEIADLMSERKIKRVPIVDRNSVVGMVSLGDISNAKGKKNEAGNTLRDITKQDFR
ncbi:MAG: CBS domain-containing protein [Eubacteriaceae bacterium]